MGCVNESLVCVLATKKNNRCLETTAAVHQAQNALTQPSQPPCKVSTWEMKPAWARDQNTGLQSDPTVCDSSLCLSVPNKKVPAVTSIPLSRLYPGAPHGSLCRGKFHSRHRHTYMRSSYCPSQSFSWHIPCVVCGGKDSAQTAGALPARDSRTWAE